MKNSKKITLIFIASVSVIMVIAGCSPRRMNENRITNPQARNTKEVRTIYQNTLTSLVSNGTITQAQSDRVLNEVTNKTGGMINQNQNENINQTITPRNANDGSITSNQANNQVGTGNGARTGTITGTGTRTGTETGNVVGNGTGPGMGTGIQNGAATPNGTVYPNGTVTSSEAVTPNGNRTGTEYDRTNTTTINNDLSQLVKNGTITQAQANIINQRVAEAMKNNR